MENAGLWDYLYQNNPKMAAERNARKRWMSNGDDSGSGYYVADDPSYGTPELNQRLKDLGYTPQQIAEFYQKGGAYQADAKKDDWMDDAAFATSLAAFGGIGAFGGAGAGAAGFQGAGADAIYGDVAGGTVTSTNPLATMETLGKGVGFQGAGADAIYGEAPGVSGASGGQVAPGYYDGAQGLINQGVTDASGNLITSPGATAAGGFSGGTAASTGSALSRLMNGSATAADYATLVGSVGAVGSSLYGLNAASNLSNAGAGSNIPTLPTVDTGGGGVGGPGAAGGSAAALDFSAADPWGTSGGRALAGDKLKTLLSDPSSTYELPGYKAGLEAVQRSMAAQGYNGSGNMMAALQKYGGQFYNDAVAQLSQLGGGTQNPATIGNMQLQSRGQDITNTLGQGQLSVTQRGQDTQTNIARGQLNLQGQVAGADLASRSLGSLGYGVQQAIGSPPTGGLSPQLLAQLGKLGGLI